MITFAAASVWADLEAGESMTVTTDSAQFALVTRADGTTKLVNLWYVAVMRGIPGVTPRWDARFTEAHAVWGGLMHLVAGRGHVMARG
jgi:hypothetical protein